MNYVAWKNANLTAVGKNLSLCTAHGHQCHFVTLMEGVKSGHVVEDLQCDHEEYDTSVTERGQTDR